MAALTNFGQISFIIATFLLSSTLCDVQRGEKEGYYAFEEAPSRFMRPPQVRKPPYMMSSIPCQVGTKKPSPKYTLCGDLNKGFIPMNPLGQEFNGQPYPFELIKNKTLVFLSKTLPYLKQDPKIPKVTKISTKKQQQPHDLSHPYGYRRQMNNHPQRLKRSINETFENETVSTAAEKNARFYIPGMTNDETSARQNCDQGGASGLLCTLTSAMSGSKIPLALMSAVAQTLASSVSSEPTTTTTESPSYQHLDSGGHSSSSSDGGGGGGMADALVGLLGTLANMGLVGNGPGASKDSSLSEEEPSTLAHVLSVLTGASPGSSNALGLVLKLMASDASPLKALASGGFPSRRRRPVAADDLMTAESSVRRPHPQDDMDLPPTPCASSEEYVTPTFARNYQGVWKYVVQIPQEGYFTQTVQQTKCLKSRCDFMDGVCHESPRWVSLLVAETYYPESFLPPAASTPLPPPPPVEDFYNFQQYLRRRVGEADDDEEQNHPESRGAVRRPPVYSSKDNKKSLQQCDGVDHIGCYVVRLYYDWFLVNGSCKCWKPSPKRVLTGR